MIALFVPSLNQVRRTLENMGRRNNEDYYKFNILWIFGLYTKFLHHKKTQVFFPFLRDSLIIDF